MTATQLLSILQRDHFLQYIFLYAVLHCLWILIGLYMTTYMEVTTFQHFKTIMVSQPLIIHKDGISENS